MEEHLFRWDEIKWEEIKEKDKNRIINFIIKNYDPKLSQTAKIEKIDAKTIKVTDGKSTVLLILETDKGRMNVKTAEKIDELIVKKDMYDQNGKEFIIPTNSSQGPGDRFVGYTGIILTLTYLFLLSLILIYSLVQFWPHEAFIDKNANYVIVISNDSSSSAQAFNNDNAKYVVIVSNDGSVRAQTLTDRKANSSISQYLL